MRLLSQRDPRWSYIQVGTGGRSIGQVGCTITCLSMLADVNPDYTNQRMNAVKGYASGNLVIWGKVSEALPNLQFIKRVSGYNNNDVKNNLPCLIEVDGAPIGGYRHWVVFIGNGKLYDPWDGREKPTSSYSPTGYAIFKVKNTPPPPTSSDDQKFNQIMALRDVPGSNKEKLQKIRVILG